MANKTVRIYERVKVQGNWTDRSVSVPKLKADGTMYLKDNREGKFRISWYEGKIKEMASDDLHDPQRGPKG